MAHSRMSVPMEGGGQDRTEAVWRNILRASSLGLWDWDVSTGKVWWTPSMARLHGIGFDATPPDFTDYMTHVALEDRRRTQEAMAQAAQAGKEFAVEYRVRLPEGNFRWLECMGWPAPRRQTDRGNRIVGLCADVTERRHRDDLAEGRSVPVLPIDRHILLLPLMGSIDQRRSGHVADRLLAAVHEGRTRVVVLDITGVSAITGEAMDDLLAVIDAIRLLGAEAVLTGVSAAVAEILVETQVDVKGVIIERDLQEGIRHARDLLGAEQA